MIEMGKTCKVRVAKEVDFGVYLDAYSLGEILLPKKFVPDELTVDDTIEVFLYFDSEDRPVATTQIPKAMVAEFAYLEVVSTTEYGAFLDWGLDKDLLVPFAEQHRPMEIGHSYIVFLYIDKKDGRIVASSKIDKFLDDERPHDFQPQQQVNIIVANSTELGFKAIIDNSHWGVLYQNEVFERLSFGQYKTAFIKQIRSDNKIDLSLQGGQETRDENEQLILNHLTWKNGFAPVHDKSSPEDISKIFGISKGAFKKTIGRLYKKQLITIGKDGIRLKP
ncbi:MAG: GntR family transcriptional regulator [Pseudomonadales bacterium]|nr:GntR family transcriptional regulator [Pseudomonadales bacterium]